MAKTSEMTEESTALHTNHDKHLCEMVRKRNMADAAQAAKDARFICHICGRAAANGDNLCEPVRIP